MFQCKWTFDRKVNKNNQKLFDASLDLETLVGIAKVSYCSLLYYYFVLDMILYAS